MVFFSLLQQIFPSFMHVTFLENLVLYIVWPHSQMCSWAILNLEVPVSPFAIAEHLGVLLAPWLVFLLPLALWHHYMCALPLATRMET